MRLHLLGIFYTIHNPDASQCAFTGKCIRFAKMMQAQGFDVVEYANEGSVSEAKEKVVVLDRSEFDRLTALREEEFPDAPTHVSSTLCKTFEERLIEALAPRLEKGDIICHPFGMTHGRLGKRFPDCFHIETGIGYASVYFKYRIYESYAWWHYHLGREKRSGSNYEWVIPNYYDLDEWEPRAEPGEYILYFGRITAEKGLKTIREIAKHTDREVILCGGGDPTPFLDPAIKNLTYRPPVTGLARSELLGNAYCMLMPTVYNEPFGGAGVEGMLCGTPLIASDYGAFSETVWHGANGFRCKTLGDWLYAIEQAGSLDRVAIADMARRKYSLETCGKLYARVFTQLSGLRGKGFYDLRPIMAIPPR